MKKYIFLVLLCISSAIITIAGHPGGKGQISGKVITSDGQPAEAVTVSLKGTHFTTYTDNNGKFILRNIPAAKYQLEVSLVGYSTITQDLVVDMQKTTPVSVQLSVTGKELQEVIVTAVKNPYSTNQTSSSLRLSEPLLEVPQNIQVVSSVALSDQQIISMSDNITRNVSGAVRIEHWGDMYANISMRGSQIQAFRNGFNVVSSFWGPLTEDMSFVDHIEFVKGPAGFMLANGDPSGLYNVVTKKPTGLTKGEASFTTGSFGLNRFTLDLDGKLSRDGKLLYRINLAGQNKGSHRPYESNDRYSFAPVISYQLDEKTKLTAEYMLQHAEMTDVGSYYVFSTEGYATLPRNFTTLSPGLPLTKMNDHSVFLNLQHQINENWKFTAQTSYFNYRQNGTSLWPNAVNNDGTMIRAIGIWDAKSKMSLAQAFLNGNITTGSVTHRILTGIDVGNKEYFADWAQSHPLDTAGGGEFDTHAPYYSAPVNGFPVYDRTLNLEARAVNGYGTINQRYSGVYVQDELGFLGNRIRLTLAGRYTFVTQFSFGAEEEAAKHFTPRVGLSVSADRNTSFYALYDQAFIPQAGKLASGRSVKPVTGANMELGVKKDWAGGKWNTTLSVYRILKNDEIISDGVPNSFVFYDIGQKRAQGIEFDIKGTIVRGLNVTANYAYTNGEVTKITDHTPDVMKVGDVIPGYAKHTTNAWVSYKLQSGILKGAGISGGFTWLTDRATSNFSKTNTDLNLPDYFKLDGGLFWEKDKIRLTFNMFNILDTYLYSGGYYDWLEAYYWQSEAPRNLRFSIAYKF